MLSLFKKVMKPTASHFHSRAVCSGCSWFRPDSLGLQPPGRPDCCPKCGEATEMKIGQLTDLGHDNLYKTFKQKETT